MALEPRSPRLAVLIDADNTPAKIADRLFEEIAKLGEASARRIYGDFTGKYLKAWEKVLFAHAIVPQQQYAYVAGKNASDITLVIDAMDMLHSGWFDGFCLVSSDSDFTRLAQRIRERGLDVYGFGAKKTPESFVKACRRFIYIENLQVEAPISQQSAPSAVKSQSTPGDAVPLLKKAIEQMESDDGWFGLGALGQMLPKLFSDFDERTYGCKTLSELVRKTGAFELDQSQGRHLRVKLKPETAATAPKPRRRRRSSTPRATPSAGT
jgi:hypothetical protein